MFRKTDNRERPLLLRETAEIALTEVKRFVEPRLCSDFNLRRVSAPLCLPAGSGLNGPGEPVRFRIKGSGTEMELITGLDAWLRAQLVRYDSAAGFGVFAVMNAVRPEIQRTAITSPDLCAWAWQQVLPDDGATDYDILSGAMKRMHAILRDAEKMLLEKFPHMHSVIPADLEVVRQETLVDEVGEAHPEHMYMKEHRNQAAAVMTCGDDIAQVRLLVWNELLHTHLELAEISITPPGVDAPLDSLGGYIWRDTLALHILHQTELLK